MVFFTTFEITKFTRDDIFTYFFLKGQTVADIRTSTQLRAQPGGTKTIGRLRYQTFGASTLHPTDAETVPTSPPNDTSSTSSANTSFFHEIVSCNHLPKYWQVEFRC